MASTNVTSTNMTCTKFYIEIANIVYTKKKIPPVIKQFIKSKLGHMSLEMFVFRYQQYGEGYLRKCFSFPEDVLHNFGEIAGLYH